MIQKGLNYLFFYLPIIILSACNYLSNPQEENVHKYFDLEEYFNNEINRLRDERLYLVKKFKLNDSEETDTLFKVNWEKELSVFKDANINKPALYGLYSIDTVIESGSSSSILYKTLDYSFKVQELKITYKNNQINEIYIDNHSDNIFYSAKELINYVPGKSYRIRKMQHIIGTKQENIDICCTLLRFQ